jgi:hypothetical protein
VGLKLSDFQYDLPEGMIARYPAKPRDALMEKQVEGTITGRAPAEAFLRDWAKKNLR